MAGVPDSQAQKDMGARLRAIREALGLTQDELSETMGVVVTTLSGWETGRNQIDIVKLVRAADRWGFTTDWVARGDLSSLRRDLGDRVEAVTAHDRPPRRGRPALASKQPPEPPHQPVKPRERDPPRPTMGGSANKIAQSGNAKNVLIFRPAPLR